MKYTQCPATFKGKDKSLFLAGGISNCESWQDELVQLLHETNLNLINPRRMNFDITNPKMTKEQIKWEHAHLKKATAISFYFPPQTLCPITLFEYGKFLKSKKKLFVCVHPDYARKLDLEIQTKLEKPQIKITYSLKHLAKQIKLWEKTKTRPL